MNNQLEAIVPQWIKIHRNALTKDECEDIINFTTGKLEFQPLTSNIEGYRTSNHFFMNSSDDIPINDKIQDQTTLFINKDRNNNNYLPPHNQEMTSISRYEKGQEFKGHHDYFHKHTKEYEKHVNTHNTNIIMTAVFYLNDDFEGGETYFPILDLTIKPELGMCVTWVNIFDNGELNQKSSHAGLPVISGEKFIATKWIRKTKYKNG